MDNITMKCPFCNVEMKKIVQKYPGYDMPDLIQYDHPATECEHGIVVYNGRFSGHTKTEKGWMDYYKKIKG